MTGFQCCNIGFLVLWGICEEPERGLSLVSEPVFKIQNNL